MRQSIGPENITGVVLAGGRGSRMGGVDKGLQLFNGVPLAWHALRRLQPQVGRTMVNANRHVASYAAFGVPVWPDSLAGYPGPLAGFITALQHCDTPYLATVPCDAPLFPEDLVMRLARAMEAARCDMAVAAVPAADDAGRQVLRIQPVFCLMHRNLLHGLEWFVAGGGRKAEAWATHCKAALVPFDTPRAFVNVNTLRDLQALQQ